MLLAYVVVAMVIVVVVRLVTRFLAYRAIINKLPGEQDFRILTGTLHKFPGLNEEGLKFDCDKAKQFIYLHRVWAGPFFPATVIFHPEIVKLLLKSQAPKPRNNWFATTYDMGIRWLGEGLLLTNGDRWARSRRLLTPAFHFEILKPYLDVYNTSSDILLKKFDVAAKDGKSFDVYPVLSKHALDVILRCAFSYHSDCQTTGSENEYSKVIAELQSMWSARAIRPQHFNEFIYSMTSDGRKFYRLCDIAHKVSEQIIENRKKELEKDQTLTSKKKMKDFLDILLSARDEDGQGLSLLELRNEVDTFMFAGHDTTASAMTWTLYALAGHPDYQERVYDEIVSILGDKEELEWNDLPKLEYLMMCMKEAIRIHCPVPFIERRAMEDIVFQEYRIPAGSMVAINIYALHHNPHVWDDPDEYQPDRFHPDKQRHMHPFQFVPFSAGSRNCIGQNFALNEMRATITKIIHRFKLSVDPEQKPKHVPMVTMKPDPGLYLYATPRP